MQNNNFIETSKIKSILFYIVLTGFIIICVLMLVPFLKILGWAIAFAIIAHPIHFFINRKIKHPTISAFLSCIIIVVVILVPAIFLINGIIQEFIELSKTIQLWIKEEKFKQFLSPLNIKIINQGWLFIDRNFDLSTINFEATLQDTLKQVSSFIGKHSVNIVKNIILLVVQMGLTLVILFFMLRDGKRILAFIKPFIPLAEEDADLVLKRAKETIQATVIGWLVVGIIQGTLLGIAFFFLKLPSPLFWGGVTAVLCFIPYVGAPFIWVPTVIILLIQKIWWKAIFLALWGFIVINLVDNFLRPILVGAKMKLHPVIVFFAIFGGFLLIGPLGLLLGPVILAITITLLDVVKHKLNPEQVINIVDDKNITLENIEAQNIKNEDDK